jgi:hypothetical protein
MTGTIRGALAAGKLPELLNFATVARRRITRRALLQTLGQHGKERKTATNARTDQLDPRGRRAHPGAYLPRQPPSAARDDD